MAILKFDKRLDFTNRLTLHPSKSFISSSNGSTTGSIELTQFPIRQRVDLDDGSTFQQGTRKSLRVDALAQGVNKLAFNEADGINNYFEHLSVGTGSAADPSVAPVVLSAVKNVSNYGPDEKSFYISRFTPHLETVTLEDIAGTSHSISIASSGSYRKNYIRKRLYKDFAGIFRKCDWAYSNANTINFFTASSVNANCAVIYPDPTGSDGTANYRPDSGFTFEFFINPRYTTDKETDEFKAGTILHYSSAYALSLVTGSSKSVDGKPDGFRLMLQLSSSADTIPSSLAFDASPSAGKEMVYSSSDNSLTFGNWHHVAVRWGGLNSIAPVQEGTGSFVIDGKVDTTFVIPSASITAPPGATSFVGINGREDSNALFIGNYFGGTNAAAGAIAGFFNSNASTNEGVLEIPGAAGALTVDPPSFGFTNKLNAEIHEVRVFKEFRDLNQINTHMSAGFSSTQFSTEKSSSLSFYLPPFFVAEGPSRRIFDRPFTLTTSTHSSSTPFNVTASFGSEMFDLNAPNFFRDFVTSRYPRFFNLTGSSAYSPNNTQTANQQLLKDQMIKARNFLIMPNDNGTFAPGYDLLKTGTFSDRPSTGSLLREFVNDRGTTDFSIITLNRMLGGKIPKKYNVTPSGSLYEPTYPEVTTPETDFSEAFLNDQEFDADADVELSERIKEKRIIGTNFKSQIYDNDNNRSPSKPANNAPATEFYVFETTGDESSSQAVFFNIPNIFYGKRIKPGSLVLKDSGLTGSNGKIPITLKDDGFGSIYRSNSSNPNKLHSVGNIFYDHGVVAIKSPHLFQFASSSFEVSFKGTQDIFNREILVEAPKNLLNSSSNPTFQKLAPTDNANEIADEFVYITTVLLHDENLNVIGRATLSQPIVKRVTDGITFRLKKDF